jgi:hypothetical protein
MRFPVRKWISDKKNGLPAGYKMLLTNEGPLTIVRNYYVTYIRTRIKPPCKEI